MPEIPGLGWEDKQDQDRIDTFALPANQAEPAELEKRVV